MRQRPPGLVRSPLPSLGPAAPKGPVVKYNPFQWAWGRACWSRTLRAPQSCPRLRGCQSPKTQPCDLGATSAPPQRTQPACQQHASPTRKRAPTRVAENPITHTRSLARSCGFVCFFPKRVAPESFVKNHHTHAAQGAPSAWGSKVGRNNDQQRHHASKEANVTWQKLAAACIA